MIVALKVIHFYALMLGAAGGFGSAIMARKGGPPSPATGAVMGVFAMLGRWAIGLLWVSGLLLAWLEFGTLALGWAFYVKLLGATAVLGLTIFAARTASAARAAGGPPPAETMKQIGMLTGLAVFVTVVMAVVAFN